MSLAIIVSLQFSVVQTFVSKRVAAYLSTELEATITLDRVYFKPFSSLELVNFQWKDKYDKNILSAKSLEINLALLTLFENKFDIDRIKIEEADVHLEIYKDSTNFSTAISYFNINKNEKKEKKNKIEFTLDRIEFKNNRFKVVNHNYQHHNNGVDFSNLDIKDFSAIFDNIELDSIIKSTITGFTLKEKSGLIIHKLETEAIYAADFMNFKDLYLETNRSIVTDYLRFDFDHISDFSDFLNKVHITANINATHISSKDIEFFAPTLKNVIFDTEIKKAKVKGTVSNIIANDVQLKTSKKTELEGDFTIKGLPKINSTIFNFNIKKLTSSAEDVEYLVPRFSNQNIFNLPKQLFTLGNIDFNGSFVGLYNDFNVDGVFKTDLGSLSTTSKINIKKPIQYTGKVQSTSFEVGTFINDKTIEKTALNLNFNGSGLNIEDLSLKVDGYLEHALIKAYSYNKISFASNIQYKTLNLEGKIDDDNLDINFSSSIDWQQSNPAYLLNAKIYYANLKHLKWSNKDSIILHKASLNTNLIGNSLNTLVGKLYVDSIKMSTTKGDFQIDNINFTAAGDEKNRSLDLQSDVVSASIQGNIDLNTIIPYFKSLAMRYAPASAIEVLPYNPQNFNLEVEIKSFQPIAALIDPNLSLDDGAYLNADFSSDDYSAKFIAFSPTLIFKGMKLTNLAINEIADDKAFSLDVTADRLNFSDSTYIKNINITNKLANDSLRFSIEMSESNATNYLNLNGNIHFVHNAPAYIKFQPSSIIINKENWTLNKNALMQISKGKIYINNLLINQGQQQVKINGIISNENDQVDLSFDKFSLSSLNGITKPLGINLQGSMNGVVQIHSLLKNPFASANILTGPIIYNGSPIGKLDFSAVYDPDSGIANLGLNILDDRKRGITLDGDFDFTNSDEKLKLTGKITEMDLSIFQPFLRNLISDLKGRSNGDIAITGTFNNPKISGTARFNNTAFTVNYLKTTYNLDNQFAQIQNNNIILQNFTLNDLHNHQAKANGIIDLSKLSKPYIDIDINANNLSILKTTFKDNNLYYGTAYATGNFKFKGISSAIAIDINAKSESGTIIHLPFNSAMTVSDNDFIYFVNKDSSKNEIKKPLFNGLTLNMDLTLTPDADLNLQTNLGTLKGNGNGTINMKISGLGDFEMFGDYIVNNGKFHFTAQDFINKYFDIKSGGAIRWTGNPSEAIINLNAIYQQRTAIRPLYNAAGRDGEDERVLAQADMLIKGTLEKPDISFDLNFPQNPYIKDQLQSFLSDANNVNQQALSLIVRRSFTPSSTEEIGREVNNTLLSAGTEIAFNQLNNIISQSLNVNFFDLNIRSFNDASASFRFWDDRLILTGGITDRTNFQATDLTFFREGITTDAELTFKLRNDGSLMLRAYNRPYTRNFLLRSTDSDYISALGLVYRQEFNSINEFWKRLWNWGGIKKEDKPKEKK